MGDTVRVVKDCPYPLVASARFNSLVAAPFSSRVHREREAIAGSGRFSSCNAWSLKLTVRTAKSHFRMFKYQDGSAVQVGDSVLLEHGKTPGTVELVVVTLEEMKSIGVEEPGIMLTTAPFGRVFR